MKCYFDRFVLDMTWDQAYSASHQGRCDEDVLTLAKEPKIAHQLDKINADDLRSELRAYGAWDSEELQDHEQNLQRILWIAAGNIRERKQS
jgi:folate-binding Fe-S cluster repair protein YgfZ